MPVSYINLRPIYERVANEYTVSVVVFLDFPREHIYTLLFGNAV